MLTYTESDTQKVKDALADMPFSKVYRSTLGGEAKASIMITISLDKPENWNYGYIENSRYAKFAMHGGEDRLEKFSGWNTLKFRKAKIKSVDDAIARLVKWYTEAQNGEKD